MGYGSCVGEKTSHPVHNELGLNRGCISNMNKICAHIIYCDSVTFRASNVHMIFLPLYFVLRVAKNSMHNIFDAI